MELQHLQEPDKVQAYWVTLIDDSLTLHLYHSEFDAIMALAMVKDASQVAEASNSAISLPSVIASLQRSSNSRTEEVCRNSVAIAIAEFEVAIMEGLRLLAECRIALAIRYAAINAVTTTAA